MPFCRLSENALFFKTTPCVGVMPLFNRSFVFISFSGTWRTVDPRALRERRSGKLGLNRQKEFVPFSAWILGWHP